jgi:hypothetical protein
MHGCARFWDISPGAPEAMLEEENEFLLRKPNIGLPQIGGSAYEPRSENQIGMKDAHEWRQYDHRSGAARDID